MMAQKPTRKGFKSHGIREPLTTRINGILKAYPDSTQIARELLQNSDDARSSVQWYLLDHRHHAKRARSNEDAKLKLFHEDLEEYMGPALLAGSDSVFEERDFRSLKNLASSEKKGDESKIGQMGLGFNSIYHLTDCPSFISGDQFMVIEPHERIFNGERSEFTEGAVRGSFLEDSQGLEDFPDQLKTFSVLEDIDFTKSYNGTIFRLPLRTPKQAENSKLSRYPRTEQEVLAMLMELKDEALKALLFLKHVQKILIYELKEGQDTPTKLFDIDIVNAADVGAQRSQLLNDFKHHVQSASSLDQDAVLQCTVRPTFRMTHGDGRTTEETWQVTTRIGNIDKTRAAMLEDSNGDVNIAEHKLIPWVGIAAPIDPGIKLDVAGLFCFLPVGDIHLPFPVHINGHFAVEQSRRDIWTNADKKIKVQSSAGIESLWNAHLFDNHIPEAYALFLENIDIDHGTTYDLWPLNCGDGIGRDAVWEEMLSKTLSAVLSHGRSVFICGLKSSGDVTIEPYSNVYVAGRDLDTYPMLKKALHAIVNLADNVPDIILAELPYVAESLGLTSRILTSSLMMSILHEYKNQWSSTADAATRVEMVKYCLQDDNSASLVGLPLLPLAEGSWVEFSLKKAQERFHVSQEVFCVLSVSNKSLVDLDVEGYPFEEIESGCQAASKSSSKPMMYWSSMPPSLVAQRIKNVFQQEVYHNGITPTGRVSRTPDQFPSDKWLIDFWNMAHSLPDEEDLEDLLYELVGVPLIPLNRGYLAPLSEDRPVLYLNADKSEASVAQQALEIMDLRLECGVFREISVDSMLPLRGYLVDVLIVPQVFSVLSNVDPSLYQQLSTEDCHHIQRYLTTYLPPTAALNSQQHKVLRYLPVFETYDNARLVPLNASSESKSKTWHVAKGYRHLSQPWMPTSVNLLAEDQPMKNHIRIIFKIPILSKAKYLHLLISQLEDCPESEWDPILSELLHGYYELKNKADFSPLLRNLAFVQVKARSTNEDSTTSVRIKPGSAVDGSLSLFFMDEEAVFPAETYAQAAFRGPLEELGMMHEFGPSFVEERMSTLFGPSSHRRGTSHKKAAHFLYDRLNNLFSKEFMSENLLSKILSMSWLYVDSDELCCPRECRPKEDRCLVGGQMPISEFSPTNALLRERMGWTSAPPLDKVLAHFLSLIEQESSANNYSSRLEDHDIAQIYKYLAAKVQDHTSLTAIKKALHGIPWILVSGRMYTVDRVAFRMDHNLSPQFVQVPSSSLDGLYRSLGVRDNIHHHDIESILMNTASNYQDNERLTDDDAALIRRLLYALSNERTRAWSPELPVLTRDGFLRRAADVLYDDRSARHSRSGDNLLPYTFLDQRISKDVAQRLQIVMFSVRTWQESKDTAFEPFFQQEDIVDRIKGILNDYDPSGIFNEYLQNASDAGATKFSVILDTRSHKKTKVLSPEMAAWQGPALVFYNDATFTKEGFLALCKLGVGNKREDTSKIGRHGLGFNSAYHFTDVPSVVSGHSLIFFDPHTSNLPKSLDAYGDLVAQKGHRYDMRGLSAESLVDQLEPYKGFFGCDMESYFDGTIFRLPLRVKGVHSVGKSSFGGDGWSIDQIRGMVTSWIEDAKIGMLFLKNITTIELSDGTSPKVSVTKRDHSNTPPMQFLNNSITSEACQVSVVDITPTSNGIGSGSQKWLVYVEDSLPADAPQDIRSLVQEKHWNTESGVAIPLGNEPSIKPCRGRLMVHLPTPIETQLPFHLHGGFALTTNRKTLAGGSDSGNQMALWNKYLLETRLPLIAIQAYKQLLGWSFRPASVGGPLAHELSGALYLYFKHWPIVKPLENYANFAGFLRVFFQHTYTNQVFPCRGYPSELPISAIAGREVTLRGYCVKEDLESRVFPWLREGGRSIAETPPDLQVCLMREWNQADGRKYKQIDCSLLRQRLREDPGFIARQMKSKTDKQWILEELLKPMVGGGRVDGSQVDEPVEGLCVIPLMNGEWKPLLQLPVYYIAKPTAREVIDGKNLLVDTDVFDTTLLKSIQAIIVKDPSFGIEELPLEVFASILSSENADGISEDKRGRLWKYLEKFEDLTPAQELPILKTTSGTVVALARASGGLDISRASLNESDLRITTELFRRLGVVVFDAAKHRGHKHLQNLQVGYTECRAVELIAENWSTSASSFVISTEEAEFLRNIIRSSVHSQSESILRRVGGLPIWPTYGPQGSPLRPAKSSLYVSDHYSNLDHLGLHSNILREVRIMSSLADLGATPIQAAIALRDHIMPKFVSGDLQCTGQTKGAYLGLCRSLIATANHASNSHDSAKTKLVLSYGQCFLACDGSFQALNQMLLPQEELTETIFANEQQRFLNRDLYSVLMGWKFKPKIRGVDTPGVVEECARFVLEEIADDSDDPDEILSRVKHLVRHIYNNPGTTNWMDPEWKIVPRELSPEHPYNLNTPALRRYMSFATLCSSVDRDYLWTQRGFFPQDLVPPEAFMRRFPDIGKNTCLERCQHLEVLVKHIAPTLTATEHHLSFKAILFKIYKSFADDPEKDELRTSLREFMTVPYILNGDDKDPSKTKSWIWPRDLVFGIDHKIGAYQAAHQSLLTYRDFLVTAGAHETKHVEGQIELGAGRQAGELEQRILSCFETQDNMNGFMDVRFVFEGDKSILAHKVVLANVSEEVIRQLTGPWALTARRDPANPTIDIIQKIQKEDDYSAFWGLLHFLYTDDLIATNGPIIHTTVRSKASVQAQDGEDLVSERVQYLMALQQLADLYCADRLKALIAQELMLPGKVMHSNVFEIRKHAERYQNDNVVKYCNQFIQVKENANLLKKYVEDEIEAVKGRLVALEKYLGNEGGESDGEDGGDDPEDDVSDRVGAKEALEMELEDWKARLKELNKKR